MHELPIVEATVKEVLKVAGEQKATKVMVVKLVLGEFSGFVDESIEFYWPIAAKETIAEKARLQIKRVAGKLECVKCGYKFPEGERAELCPKCQSFKLKITAGDGYWLEGIEIE